MQKGNRKLTFHSYTPFHEDNLYFKQMITTIHEERTRIPTLFNKDIGHKILMNDIEDTRHWMEIFQKFGNELGHTLIHDDA